MKSYSPLVFVVLLLCLGLASVAALVVGYSRKSAAAPTATQPAELMAAQATSTPEPSATAVPTVDYSAVWPAETAAAAADDLARAQERIASAASTQAQATRSALDSVVLVGTPTALEMTRVKMVADEQAQIKRDDEARAAYFAGVAATATATAEAEKQAGTIKLSVIITGLVIVVIVFAVVAAIATNVINLAIWEKKTSGIPAIAPDNFIQPSDAQAPAYPGGLDFRLFSEFCQPSQLRKIADGLAAGLPFTHTQWTPASVCMSEGQFTKLQNRLADYQAAEWNDDTHKAGVTLTAKGLKFFADMRQTTSPLNQYAPKTTSPALKQSIDDGFIQMGEGGTQEG